MRQRPTGAGPGTRPRPRPKPKPKRYQERTWLLFLCIGIVGVMIGGGMLLSRHFYSLLSKLPFMPNYQVVDFHTYFALEPETAGLVMDDRRLTVSMPPVVENGVAYLPATFVGDTMDPFLFWDEYASALFVTTRTEVMQFTPNALDYHLNGERTSLQTPITLFNGSAYMPVDLVQQLYPYDITYQPVYNMVVVTSRAHPPSTGTVQKKSDIRYRADTKAAIEVKAVNGDLLALYEEDGDFTRVRTEDGLLGYVLTSDIEKLSDAAPPESAGVADGVETEPPLWPAGVKVNMMWEAVYNVRTNEELMSTSLPDGVNVISPTWFTLNETTLDILSLGTRDYVAWAHEQGCAVWALLADSDSTLSHAVLTDASARRRVVEQLTGYADEYDLDGINIDFEHVKETDGGYFIQFLRELAPVLRRQGVTLSVDVYVPAAWSEYYRRDLIGQTVDFVCVMTYDEHYPGSPTSGPVASLPFVRQGVSDMLELVPKEKLLMGLPFYNRIWREIANNDSPETRKVQHYGMERTKALLLDQNADAQWDHEIGSFYGEYAAVEDGETVLYRIWLEDENSIAEKLKIFKINDLAGVAGWRRGFENESVHVLLKEACGL